MNRPEWINVLSPSYLREFAETQQAPVQAVRPFLPSWAKVCGDAGGGRGMALSWMVVIGGNPGRGKSLLALNLAAEAVSHHHKTAFVSMEMSHTQLAARLYSMMTGHPVKSLEQGRFSPETFDKMVPDLWERFAGGELLTNRGLLYSTQDVMNEVQYLADQGVTVFFFDYLQLIGIGDEESINRQVTEVVSHLRAFAVERQVLVVILSQFNRQTSSNYVDSPRPQGLHGGMIVEASADQVLLLDHSRYRPLDDMSGSLTFVMLAKNRHGSEVDIPIRWNWSDLTAREGMPDEINEWPVHSDRKR